MRCILRDAGPASPLFFTAISVATLQQCRVIERVFLSHQLLL